MSETCGTCLYFDGTLAPEEDPREALGLCTWPASRLPWSLRYGSRERMAVGPLEGGSCPCFVERRKEDHT
jgi:hypothetical protein